MDKMQIIGEDFGDGREERMDAFDLECRLRRNPEIARRKADYERRVEDARKEARSMGKQAIIDKLIASNPAYILDLLETEGDRFGGGLLVERYARTFFVRRPQGIEAQSATTAGRGPQDESPVGVADAPNTPPTPSIKGGDRG